MHYNAYFKLFPQDFLPSHLLSLTPLPPAWLMSTQRTFTHPLCTSLCLLCGKHGVFVWTPFIGWFIYIPPFLLWFQCLIVLLGPLVHPAPGLPVKQKQCNQPFWPWLAPPPPPQLGLIHCIVGIVLKNSPEVQDKQTQFSSLGNC